jgi:L-alanine-DL-glutamate epimerase-like enolase superfamily enzyme
MSRTCIQEFRLTRFQFARDRVIGDAQVSANVAHIAALELIDAEGRAGLGFIQSLFHPLPSESEIERIFIEEVWSSLAMREAGAIAHRVGRPRGGNQNPTSLPFAEAIQQAAWDLLAKSLDLPLWKLLGAERTRLPAYASGLDFHLDDDAFVDFFAEAARRGFTAFKIKVGHADLSRDLHRLDLLRSAVGREATVMVDANEAWTARQSIAALEEFRRAGHAIYWLEDPILRDDFEGLKLLRASCGSTQINAGEYLDLSGKRRLLEAGACDMLNVHGQVSDVMRIGWLAAERGLPVTLGNSFLEIGVNTALALPNVDWLEYSFQNFDHLVDAPFSIKDGYITGADRAGHGLVLSEIARRLYRRPDILAPGAVGPAPISQEPVSQEPVAQAQL